MGFGATPRENRQFPPHKISAGRANTLYSVLTARCSHRKTFPQKSFRSSLFQKAGGGVGGEAPDIAGGVYGTKPLTFAGGGVGGEAPVIAGGESGAKPRKTLSRKNQKAPPVYRDGAKAPRYHPASGEQPAP